MEEIIYWLIAIHFIFFWKVTIVVHGHNCKDKSKTIIFWLINKKQLFFPTLVLYSIFVSFMIMSDDSQGIPSTNGAIKNNDSNRSVMGFHIQTPSNHDHLLRTSMKEFPPPIVPLGTNVSNRTVISYHAHVFPIGASSPSMSIHTPITTTNYGRQ